MAIMILLLCLQTCLNQVLTLEKQDYDNEATFTNEANDRYYFDVAKALRRDWLTNLRLSQDSEKRTPLLHIDPTNDYEKQDTGESSNNKLHGTEFERNSFQQHTDKDFFAPDMNLASRTSGKYLHRNHPQPLQARNRPSTRKQRKSGNKKNHSKKNRGKKGADKKDVKYWNNVLENIDEGVQVGKNLINSVQSGDVKQAVGSVLDVAQFATGLAGMIPGPIGAGFQAVSGVVSFFGGLFGPKTTTVNPLIEVNEKLQDLGEEVGEVKEKVNEVGEKVEEVGENVKNIDKKVTKIDKKIGVMDKKLDNMTGQLEEITQKLVQVSNKLLEMTNTLENVLNAVNQTQYIVKEEVRGINVKEMSTKLSAADDLLKRMLRSKTQGIVHQFVRHCDDVENFPEMFKNIIVKDTYGLKALIANEEYGYDKKKYAEFAVNTIRLFYHAAHISAICSATRHLNASDEEKEELRLEAENNAQTLMTEIADTIENDTIIPFRRLIEDETEKHNTENDDYFLDQDLNANFTRTVNARLKKIFPDSSHLFVSWFDPLNKFKNMYYPFNGNEKTVKLLTDHATGKRKPSFSNKYIHYWLGKWNRNMLFYYNSANDSPPEKWSTDVTKCLYRVQYKYITEFGEPIVNCNILFQEVKESLEEKGIPFGSVVCLSGTTGRVAISDEAVFGLSYQLFEPVLFEGMPCFSKYEKTCYLRGAYIIVFPK